MSDDPKIHNNKCAEVARAAEPADDQFRAEVQQQPLGLEARTPQATDVSLFGTCTIENSGSLPESANNDLLKTKTADNTTSVPVLQITGIESPRQAAVEASILARLGDRAPVRNNDGATIALGSKHEKANDAAREFETRGRKELSAAHRGLKVTTDGSPAVKLEYRENVQLSETKTALDLAKELAGPKASDEQVKAFAQGILSANNRSLDDTTFKSGTSINLPGQTADGGIFVKKNGTTSTDWSDGTRLYVNENGSGGVRTSTASGDPLETNWDPKNLGGNYSSSLSPDKEIRVDASGQRVEKVFVPGAGPDKEGDYLTSKVTMKDEHGNTFDLDVQPGKDKANRILMTHADGSTLEFQPNKSGQFLTADGKHGLGMDYQHYTRSLGADGTETKTFDYGNFDKFDSKGHILQSGGTDDWGRKALYDFRAGEKMPYQVTIETKDGHKVELHRQKDSSFKADNVDAQGTKIGTISMGKDGRLIYKNDQDKTTHTQLKDGTTLDKKTNDDGTSSITFADGKTGFVVQYDNKGHKTSETYTGTDGRILSKHFSQQGKQVDEVRLESKDGSLTVLNFDTNAQVLRGHRVDATGHVVESVSLQEDKLVFADVNTGAVRAEKFIKPEGDMGIPKIVPGQYDRNTGKFTYTNDKGEKTTESFAPGRTDTLKTDGTILGETITGDSSTLKANGEATVLHSDETGVRLNANGTIDRWGPNEKDNAYGERLSAQEAKFVNEHKDVDRRDIAEVHRRFAGDAAKLDAFYQQLNTIDGAKNLSPAEASALRGNIVHHIAYPAEIYQGRSPSCNVTVVQRDVAMSRPDLYVKQIVQAVSEGQIKTAEGTSVLLDPTNLKSHDSSGRDLASRIYQTTALAVEFSPHAEFRNSEDGVGLLYPKPFNPADKSVAFPGLNIAQIVETRYKLTGEEKAVALVDNVDELAAAYKTNGNEPMIVAVDGSKAPFDNNGPVGASSGSNHVTTLVGLTRGKEARAFVQNQWGLQSDHSTFDTALSAAKLIDNMRAKYKVGGANVTAPAMVITNGDHNKGYEIVKGKLVMSPSLSATIQKGIKMVPTIK